MTDEDFHLAYTAADALAAYVLRDTRDKHGRPLIEHCRRVADRCKGLRYEQRVAAVLHDVAEDGEDALCIDRGRIVQMLDLFGVAVSDLVDSLTRREGEDYSDYIETMMETNTWAVPIKLADLADNLDESRGPIPGELRGRYESAYNRLMTWASEKMELPAWAWERWHTSGKKEESRVEEKKGAP